MILNLLLILALIGLVLYLIVQFIPMPAPAKQVIVVVGIILMLVVSLRALGVWF